MFVDMPMIEIRFGIAGGFVLVTSYWMSADFCFCRHRPLLYQLVN